MNSPKLTDRAREAIQDPDSQIFVSTISAYEIAFKYQQGKLRIPFGFLDNFEQNLREESFFSLPVTITHSLEAGKLIDEHRDPFDRILVGQAIIEDLALVTIDEKITGFAGLSVLW